MPKYSFGGGPLRRYTGWTSIWFALVLFLLPVTLGAPSLNTVPATPVEATAQLWASFAFLGVTAIASWLSVLMADYVIRDILVD